MSSKLPSMTEMFAISEAQPNLNAQLKTATPTNVAQVSQNAVKAAQQARQTLGGVAKDNNSTIAVGKTDEKNPIANVFVKKKDGSADVLDPVTGQLKPVPATTTSQTPQKAQPVGGMT